MTSVAPKIYFCPIVGTNIPVWEITTDGGSHIYYERPHRPGYLPIGVQSTFSIDNSIINVVQAVCTKGNKVVNVLKQKDGFHIPEHWYEKMRLDGSEIEETKDNYVPEDRFYSGPSPMGEEDY